MNLTKPYCISKELVDLAYRKVKEKNGAAGVDRQSILDFDQHQERNLYKIWNRMSSGSYFPKPVRTVMIPKSNGKMRKLGIPTIVDRIAQTVVKMLIEPQIDPMFHPDSYGYRPGKSPHQALAKARVRCWQQDWVIDLDIADFFGSVDHELLLKAVKRFVKEPWMILYIERWIKAPTQEEDGTITPRERGIQQGSAISPLLANLFLHIALDSWLKRTYPSLPFERFADDWVGHCHSEEEAKQILASIKTRLQKCGLALNQEKTKIVYCQDDNRRNHYLNDSFDFLGFTFRSRCAKSKAGKCFSSFAPAISNKASKEIRQTIRQWRIHRRTVETLNSFSRFLNPVIRGWIEYYGKYYRSEIYQVLRRVDAYLIRWVCQKYKSFRRQPKRAKQWLWAVKLREPTLFAHWEMITATEIRYSMKGAG